MAFGDERYGGIGWFAWYTNLLLIPAWLGLGLSQSRFGILGGLALTIVGLGLATTAVLIKRIPLDVDITAAVTSMGLGFYLWWLSFAICVVGYSALIARAKSKSHKAITNQ